MKTNTLSSIRNLLNAGEFAEAKAAIISSLEILGDSCPESLTKAYDELLKKIPYLKQDLSVLYICDQEHSAYRHYRGPALIAEFEKINSYKTCHSQEVSTDLLSAYNLIVLCRIEKNTKILANFLDEAKRRRIKIIYDIDDPIFDINAISEKYKAERAALAATDITDHPWLIKNYDYLDKESETLQRISEISSLIGISDLITVSTPEMAKMLRARGFPTVVLPNAPVLIKDSRDFSRKSDSEEYRIGLFFGNHTHLADFYLIRTAITSYLKEDPQAKLIICGSLIAIDPITNELNGISESQFEYYSHQDYYNMIEIMKSLDVMLVPLENCAFSNCKSEIKLFEANYCNIPVIASPSKSYSALLKHLENSYLADTNEDWIEGLRYFKKSNHLKPSSRMERFRPDLVAKEYLDTYLELFQKQDLTIDTHTSTKYEPCVSIISVLYRKDQIIDQFLSSIINQDYLGDIEVILVDDASPTNDVEVVENFVSKNLSRVENINIRILSNAENLGNCKSRNKAILEAKGDYIFITDCDCLLSNNLISEAIYSFTQSNCDVVIGAMNIETNGLPPMHVLNRHSLSSELRQCNADLQDKATKTSFVNLITRNFCIKRTFLEINFPNMLLFDDNFGYSACVDSGFGWEDVEMGYRIWRAGASIVYNENIVTVHCSHPDSSSTNKAKRSLKNFRRLLEKHPSISLESTKWFRETFNAISKWVTSSGIKVEDLDDHKFILKNISGLNSINYTKRSKPLKVLTYRWHVPHQYEIYKNRHNYTLVSGLGSSMCEQWEFKQRPMPNNAKIVSAEKINPNDYDIAILHFDENIMGNEPILNPDWGKTFHNFLSLTKGMPQIAICHGTPQFIGQYTDGLGVNNWGKVIESNRIELVNLLADIHVVCNSYQAQSEWNFKKSSVIWHGFSPSDYNCKINKSHNVLSMRLSAMEGRPYYNGLNNFNQVKKGLDLNKINMDHFDLQKCPLTDNIKDISYLGFNSFKSYINTLKGYGIYFNPTQRSPMPRSRGEAMMSGLASVSMKNHDVELFISNGINGFYSETVDEAVDYISFLRNNPLELTKVKLASRNTALKCFNIDRFLQDWENLIDTVI